MKPKPENRNGELSHSQNITNLSERSDIDKRGKEIERELSLKERRVTVMGF